MENENLFFEAHAAAQSLKNFWTRLAATNGCIEVRLSRDTLSVKPHWFAGWLIFLLRLDLRHEIPVSDVKAVEEKGESWGYGKVEVRFRDRGGEERRLLLYLKKHREFTEELERLIQGAPAASARS